MESIFTARIRRMGEGTFFSLFVSSHLDGGGYPVMSKWGYPKPRSGRGLPTSQVRMGKPPISGQVRMVWPPPPPPRLRWEYEHLRSGQGSTPILHSGWGTPTPHVSRMGILLSVFIRKLFHRKIFLSLVGMSYWLVELSLLSHDWYWPIEK